MASPNFVVTSLPAYVQNNRDLLLKNFGLAGTGTRGRISLQTGVKKSAYINILDIAPELQNGSECGFNAQGAATLSQREIKGAPIKVDMDICPRNLVGKWAEYLVRVNATEKTLPFEQYIMDGVVSEINKKIERLIWQGDTDQSSNNDLRWIDGFVKQAGAEEDVIDVTFASGSSAYAAILAVYFELPEEVIERGAEIYVSPAIYRNFLQEMVVKNYFHYAGPEAAAPEEFILPGTDVKVVKTAGLSGTLHILGTFAKNLVYGTDMEGDAEDIDLWYSQDDRVFKFEALWTSAAGIAFPELVAFGTLSAAPAAPTV